MIALDPKKLFRRLAGEIPKSLHRHVLIVGSLAAAYHYRAQLKTRAVNTKDADLIVHPTGDVGSCRKIAERLLGQGWTRTDKCYPMPRPRPTEDLRVIRLHPPKSRDYFVEILGLPRKTQKPLVVRRAAAPERRLGEREARRQSDRGSSAGPLARVEGQARGAGGRVKHPPPSRRVLI